MEKTAWFITHDDYIDRRIFFFVEVLKKHGYKVKLFPYMYPNIMAAKDPLYVCRPERDALLREYYVQPEMLEEEEYKLIENIRVKREAGEALPRKSQMLELLELEGGFAIKYYKPECTIMYESITGSYSRQYYSNNNVEIKRVESALLQVRKESINLTDNAYEYNGIAVAEIINENYERCVLLQPVETTHLYVYNTIWETLSERVKMSEHDGGDCLEENTSEFKDFRKIIYDYLPIFTRVKQELLKEKPDIVYVADLPTLPIGIILKRVFGCKLIMDCHEWWYKQTVLWEKDLTEKISLVDKYEKELYPECDLLITVGEHLAGQMEEHIGKTFCTIYSCMSNGFKQRPAIDKNFLLEKYQLPADSKLLIFQGGMSNHRNLDNLARMTKQFSSDVYLLLLSSGIYQDVFKKILQEEGNPERVVWGGWISQDELLTYTQNVDLGIIPYVAVNDYARCFVPNKLMEYFEVKLPIVYDPSLQELKLVIGGNNVGFGVDLTDPVIAGKAIDDLLHDEDRLQEYRTKYLSCSAKFGFEEQEKIFNQLLEGVI